MRVDIWADLVCPWCYLGKRRFETALKQAGLKEPVEIVHHSFQLDPTMPRGETVNQTEVLVRKYGRTREQIEQMQRQLEQTATAEGLPYRLVGGKAGNTWDAHQVVHMAREKGLEDAVLERLYQAHFIEQRSLFDPESLAQLAQEAGLDAADVREALEAQRYSNAVEKDVAQARELGISGVPFFVFNGQYGVSGAQPPEVFEQVLKKVAGQV